MGRAVVGLAHACGLLLVLAVSAAEPACTGSELTVKARGGIGALSVTWRLTAKRYDHRAIPRFVEFRPRRRSN
ncbi:MAG: hypothetical protein DME13_21925 [Candidatus Rokuibacteriota bacterium]|nr:MAG: hypothetical protein DME13_21925 [Candidatus Rokubacteria bacterium]